MWIWVGGAYAGVPPGEYTLTGGRVTVDVASWGPDCGPQPQNERDPAGARYTLNAQGELAHGGRTRALFEAGICARATGLPGMRGALSGDRAICRNLETSKQVNGYARLDAGDPNQLVVTHRFEYAWTLKGSQCRLTSSGRWQLARVAPLDRCRTPGPVAQLTRVGAAKQRLWAGRGLRFAARATDAEGCPVTVKPTWRATVGRIDAEGVLYTSAADAGTGEVEAQVGAAKVRWTVTVRAPRRRAPTAAPAEASATIEELLPEWTAGLPDPDADGGIAPQDGLALTASVAPPASPGGPSGWVIALFAALGVLALALGAWITWTARRLDRRRPASTALNAAFSHRPRASVPPAAGAPTDADPAPRAASPAPSMAAPHVPSPTASAPAPSEAQPAFVASTPPASAPTTPASAATTPARHRVCPTCQTRWPDTVSHCGHDGAPLGPPTAAQGSAAPDMTTMMVSLQAKICPVCQTRYPAQATYCGLDGARLGLLK